MSEKLENKLLNTLKEFTDKIGNIREMCKNDFNKNIDSIENETQKKFLKESLNSAIKGELSADQFIKQFKDIT